MTAVGCVAIAAALFLSAAPPPPLATDYVEEIEVNTYGEPGSQRTALIYRDADGIRDWKWLTPSNMPMRLEPGRYMAAWNDGGTLRVVYCRMLTFSRTLRDQEVEERSQLPEHKRRRLSK